MDKKILIAGIAAAIVAGAAAYFSYNSGYQKGYTAGVETGRAAAKTEASQAVTNPLENLPSTNPFEKAINPFKELYKNPFK
mgnify:CR=1 FL=1